MQRLKSFTNKRLLALLGFAALFGSFAAPASAQLQICRFCVVTDPCTGTVFTAGGCCTLPKLPRCIVASDMFGCIGGVAVGCV